MATLENLSRETPSTSLVDPANDNLELDWHDTSLILAMLELTPWERILRGEETARQMVAFRDAVAGQLASGAALTRIDTPRRRSDGRFRAGCHKSSSSPSELA